MNERRLTRKFFMKNKEKEYQRLIRTRDELFEASRNVGYVTINPPRRHGWKKFFVLRKDIANRSDAYVFKHILSFINTTIYNKDKKFLVKDWKTSKLVPQEHELKTLYEDDFKKLSEQERKYFFKTVEKPNRYSSRTYNLYRFGPEWMFVPEIKKHFITRLPILDNELDSKIKELENKIQANNLWAKLYGGHSYWDRDWDARKQALLNKELNEELSKLKRGLEE